MNYSCIIHTPINEAGINLISFSYSKHDTIYYYFVPCALAQTVRVGRAMEHTHTRTPIITCTYNGAPLATKECMWTGWKTTAGEYLPL